MRFITQLRCYLIPAVCLGFTTATLATDYQSLDVVAEKMRQMSLREVEIQRKFRNLNVIDDRVSYLRQLRQDALLGPHGLLQKSLRSQESLTRWVGQWQALIATSAKLNSQNIEAFASEFDRTAEDLFGQFPQIVVDADAVSLCAKTKVIELQEKDDLPTNLIEGKSVYLEALNKQKAELQAAFKIISDSLDSKKISTYGQGILKIKHAIKLKMRGLLLQYPELATSIRHAEALLDLISISSPLVGELKNLGLKLASDLNRDAIFSAEKTMLDMEEKHTHIEKQIRQSQLDEKQKNFELDRINSVLKEARTHLDESLRNRSKRMIFASFARDQRTTLTKSCRRADMQAIYDCELLRTLNSIKLTPDDLEQLKEEDLKYIEGQILSVYLGPSYTRKHQGQ